MFSTEKAHGIGIGYIVVHLLSIGYLALHKKLEFKYHLKTTRLIILIPQLLLVFLTVAMNFIRINVGGGVKYVDVLCCQLRPSKSVFRPSKPLIEHFLVKLASVNINVGDWVKKSQKKHQIIQLDGNLII